MSFDTLAADYDRHFTATPLGALLRRAVWRRLDLRFSAGDRILELGCGTGEDAVHLGERGVRVVATDASAGMVETARAKVLAAGLSDRIEVHHLPIEGLQTDETAVRALGGPFDGALSDFGAVNCVADLPRAAAALAAHLRPGAPALLCVMGPLVPWEWAWFLRRGQVGQAFRRLRPGGVAWRGLTVRYPSIRRFRGVFSSAFRLVRVGAVNALLPPTYYEPWMARHPRLLAALDRADRSCERWPLPWLADHYLVEMVRR